MSALYGGLPLTAAARSAACSKILKDSDRRRKSSPAPSNSLKGQGRQFAARHVADIDAVRIITNEELGAGLGDKKPAKAAPRHGRHAAAMPTCPRIRQ